MTKMLKLSPDLSLPPEAVTQTFGILAVRGAGKSNLAVAMAEEMTKAGLHWTAIDPKGDWWGVRSSADGKGPGFPVVIFGGRHGDVPLEPGSGELIADMIVGERLTSVLDVSEFTDGERNRFLAAYADRLYRRKNETQDPTHVFADECDEYIPQKPLREQVMVVHYFQRLVKMGRSRGIGTSLISQRSAVINKNVLTQTENLIVLRTTAPQDRAAVEAWIEHHDAKADILGSLPGLDNGEAWVWSPHFLKKVIRTRIRRRETFDSGATPSVKSHGRAPATLADVDLGALRDKMAATIERAKAEDPKHLKARVGQLERELAAAKAIKPAAARPEVREIPALKPSEIKTLQAVAAKFEEAGAALAKAGGSAIAIAKNLVCEVDRAQALTKKVNPYDMREFSTPLAKAVREATEAREIVPGIVASPAKREPGDISDGERRLLQVLDQFSPRRLTRTELALWSVMTPGGGTFRTYLPNVKKRGLVDDDGSTLGLSALGRKELEDRETRRFDLQDVVFAWREKVAAGEFKLFDILFNEFPRGLKRQELAERAGMTFGGGTFRTYAPSIKRKGLIEDIDGLLYASRAFFDVRKP